MQAGGGASHSCEALPRTGSIHRKPRERRFRLDAASAGTDSHLRQAGPGTGHLPRACMASNPQVTPPVGAARADHLDDTRGECPSHDSDDREDGHRDHDRYADNDGREHRKALETPGRCGADQRCNENECPETWTACSAIGANTQQHTDSSEDRCRHQDASGEEGRNRIAKAETLRRSGSDTRFGSVVRIIHFPRGPTRHHLLRMRAGFAPASRTSSSGANGCG